MKAEEVSMEAFLKLTRFPIVIFYSDYMTTHPHNDYWRAASEMADLFAAVVNHHGGDAKVIRLPDIGIRGNSHFPFAEKTIKRSLQYSKNGWKKSNSTSSKIMMADEQNARNSLSSPGVRFSLAYKKH